MHSPMISRFFAQLPHLVFTSWLLWGRPCLFSAGRALSGGRSTLKGAPFRLIATGATRAASDEHGCSRRIAPRNRRRRPCAAVVLGFAASIRVASWFAHSSARFDPSIAPTSPPSRPERRQRQATPLDAQG